VGTTLVDSNIILDVITDDKEWGDWSADQLAEAAHSGTLIINPVIYAEVSVVVERIEEMDDALPASYYRRLPLPFEAAFLAGQCFVKYRRRGGDRRSPLPDFYIGAHAAIAGFTLLTRDARRYKTYFPSLRIIAP